MKMGKLQRKGSSGLFQGGCIHVGAERGLWQGDANDDVDV